MTHLFYFILFYFVRFVREAQDGYYPVVWAPVLRASHKLKDHSLPAVSDCLLSTFASIIHIYSSPSEN